MITAHLIAIKHPSTLSILIYEHLINALIERSWCWHKWTCIWLRSARTTTIWKYGVSSSCKPFIRRFIYAEIAHLYDTEKSKIYNDYDKYRTGRTKKELVKRTIIQAVRKKAGLYRLSGNIVKKHSPLTSIGLSENSTCITLLIVAITRISNTTTDMRKFIKMWWFFTPTQLFTQGQWWSKRSTHLLQILQCLDL